MKTEISTCADVNVNVLVFLSRGIVFNNNTLQLKELYYIIHHSVMDIRIKTCGFAPSLDMWARPD